MSVLKEKQMQVSKISFNGNLMNAKADPHSNPYTAIKIDNIKYNIGNQYTLVFDKFHKSSDNIFPNCAEVVKLKNYSVTNNNKIDFISLESENGDHISIYKGMNKEKTIRIFRNNEIGLYPPSEISLELCNAQEIAEKIRTCRMKADDYKAIADDYDNKAEKWKELYYKLY